jgi:hypothetical protein
MLWCSIASLFKVIGWVIRSWEKSNVVAFEKSMVGFNIHINIAYWPVHEICYWWSHKDAIYH